MNILQPISLLPTVMLLKRILLPVLIVLAALLIADRLYHPQRFQISHVEVRASDGALHRVDAAQVKATAARAINGNFFALSLPQIEKEVAALPWVVGASLRRQWPDTLLVEVTEMEPVARWGARHWLHAGGGLVARDDSETNLPDTLPLLFAPDGQYEPVWNAYQQWSALFDGAGVHITELQLDVRDLWRIKLRALLPNGSRSSSPESHTVSLIVARENADARITEFVQVLRHRLMDKFASMHSVDLRHPNGFAVGWIANH